MYGLALVWLCSHWHSCRETVGGVIAVKRDNIYYKYIFFIFLNTVLLFRCSICRDCSIYYAHSDFCCFFC